MLKFWTFACICIAVLANVAVSEDLKSFDDVIVDVVTKLPMHLNDAIDETELVDDSANALNITGRIRWPHLPRLSQCFKDYLRLYAALFQKQNRMWAIEGIVPDFELILKCVCA